MRKELFLSELDFQVVHGLVLGISQPTLYQISLQLEWTSLHSKWRNYTNFSWAQAKGENTEVDIKISIAHPGIMELTP